MLMWSQVLLLLLLWPVPGYWSCFVSTAAGAFHPSPMRNRETLNVSSFLAAAAVPLIFVFQYEFLSSRSRWSLTYPVVLEAFNRNVMITISPHVSSGSTRDTLRRLCRHVVCPQSR